MCLPQGVSVAPGKREVGVGSGMGNREGGGKLFIQMNGLVGTLNRTTATLPKPLPYKRKESFLFRFALVVFIFCGFLFCSNHAHNCGHVGSTQL